MESDELERLITVADRFQADVLSNHLKSEGIWHETRGGSMPPYFNMKGPFVEWSIYVHRNDLELARETIAESPAGDAGS